MPDGTFTAGEVMDRAASLLNDTARSRYSYTAQLPYLKTALDDFKMKLEVNNVPITNQTSQIIPVNIGDIQITGPGGAPPNYPGTLVEIQAMWERLQDSSDAFLPMSQFEFLPPIYNYLPTFNLGFFSWQNETIFFNPLGTTTAREVKIDFISSVFGDILDENTPIGMINGKNFLAFRTAALCAQFIAENKTRADELNINAVASFDDFLAINIKGKQSVTTRKRPFRAAYRARGPY